MPRAARAAETILSEFGPSVSSLTLVPSDGGRFEVEADDSLIFSKKAEGRHTSPEELVHLLREHGLEPRA